MFTLYIMGLLVFLCLATYGYGYLAGHKAGTEEANVQVVTAVGVDSIQFTEGMKVQTSSFDGYEAE